MLCPYHLTLNITDTNKRLERVYVGHLAWEFRKSFLKEKTAGLTLEPLSINLPDQGKQGGGNNMNTGTEGSIALGKS